MKTYLDGLTARADGRSRLSRAVRQLQCRRRPAYPRAEHPIVRTHPVTAKALYYVNRGFTRHIIGIPATSDAMLALYQRGKPVVPVLLPLERKCDRVLGQSCTQHRAMWDCWPPPLRHPRDVKGESV